MANSEPPHVPSSCAYWQYISNFEQKPPKRDYRDYYKVIAEPIAIEDIRDLVDNGSIDDWNALASKIRLIWTNAREYNTEESDIYRMADDLEVSFKLVAHHLAAADGSFVAMVGARDAEARYRARAPPQLEAVSLSAVEAEGSALDHGLANSHANGCRRHH